MEATNHESSSPDFACFSRFFLLVLTSLSGWLMGPDALVLRSGILYVQYIGAVSPFHWAALAHQSSVQQDQDIGNTILQYSKTILIRA